MHIHYALRKAKKVPHNQSFQGQRTLCEVEKIEHLKEKER